MKQMLMVYVKLSLLFLPAPVLLALDSEFPLIEISGKFDTGAVDEELSYFDVSKSTVYLYPKRIESKEWKGAHWWVHAKISGLRQQQPQFVLDVSGPFQGDYCGIQFLYSYDRRNWYWFEEMSLEGNCFWETETLFFRSSRPFLHDSVYVAYGHPYPVWRTDELIEEIRQSPFVHPTASSDRKLRFGTVKPGELDLAGLAGEGEKEFPLYAFRIDADVRTEQRKVVIIGGNHPGEHSASYVLEGTVRFLLSENAAASKIRKYFEFYIYPQVNPAGRYFGYFRSSPATPMKDNNRYWNSSGEVVEIDAVKNAILRDTGGTAYMFFDYHSFGAVKPLYYYDHGLQSASEYLTEVMSLEPSLQTVDYPKQAGMSTAWAATAAGLNAQFSIVTETPFLQGITEDRYLEIGTHWALGLLALIDEDG